MMTQYDSDSDVFSIISAFFHGLINIINSRLKEHQNKIEKNMKKRKTKNYYQ